MPHVAGETRRRHYMKAYDELEKLSFEEINNFLEDLRSHTGFRTEIIPWSAIDGVISEEAAKKSPIYNFYEKDIHKFLKRYYSDVKRITDPQGLEWYQFDIPSGAAEDPIPNFMAIPVLSGIMGTKEKTSK